MSFRPLITLRPRSSIPIPLSTQRRSLSTSLPRYRPSSSSSSSSGIAATVSQTLGSLQDSVNDLAEKFKNAVQQSHSEQYEGVEERGLRMLIFGKPGSGKGTLSARLVKEYDIAFVSTGDVLRKEIAAGSEVGKKAEAVVASGGLVSDELMLEIVKTELDRLHGRSWIVDGFPRTLHQGELLDSVLNQENRPLNMIVHLNVPDSVIMARISARWVHLPSGRVYNTTYSAPKVPGKDDITGEPLSKRPDDTPETFSKRLQAYYESTAPLLEYFAKTYPSSLFSLSGSSSDEVLIAAGLKAPPAAVQGKDQPETDFKTFSSTLDPNSSTDTNVNEIEHTKTMAALDQLWPQLTNLIEPFNLRRAKKTLTKDGRELTEDEVKDIRKEADDLKDPNEIEVNGKRKAHVE
ncbi:adenylate kinase [Kwoniella mangroviensis CBS 10435]|uniref:Adenylate kinase n=1 Tax=Kwoniella mangroviensis CBS 10435 TaxID=1331196 RepID=A0A1B9ITV4_9TREE|nr:adenylate kinase [Kwoniella mangroviensis CBS 8507]OCF58966.1 adenylate kinase [Kwoniella mangroviensis CBS 10435]OCF68760.1 adenylate kinase [Kwoniella mangroviensis CBS 8507]OCF76780.1 adenylate kinase [Kwoniella mangroviensis CBS 8886]